MSFIIKDCDNIREVCTSSGTTITLGGAATNSRTFASRLTNGDTTWVAARKGSEISVGEFTYSSGTNSLAQTEVYYSSNSNTAVNFSSGTGEAYIVQPSRRAAILNTKEASVATAATVDIGAIHALRIALTGTTGITSFGTVANEVRIVRHNGQTITHHATSLILLGGRTWTTAAGDISLFASDNSGNWRELFRSRAGADGRLIKSTVYTAGATWTRDAQTSFVVVEVWGGGGGGGGSAAGGTSTVASGGGGASGSYARKLVSSPGATETVTIAAAAAGGAAGNNNGASGGSCSFGSHCSATGGTGGVGSIAAAQSFGIGGAGGTGSVGDETLIGAPGGVGIGVQALYAIGGNGGSAPRGGGGARGNNVSAGGAGNAFGGGGSGGSSGNSGAAAAGGAGGTGAVVVWEYA